MSAESAYLIYIFSFIIMTFHSSRNQTGNKFLCTEHSRVTCICEDDDDDEDVPSEERLAYNEEMGRNCRVTVGYRAVKQ